MKKLLLTFSIITNILIAAGQSADSKIEKDYIQVTGVAEMQVVPDEIYIGITLRERYEGRDKISIDSIEQQLKNKLIELRIDLKNLSLSDANSDYVKVRWTKKDVLTAKDYMLKVTSASEVSKVFEELSKIKIQELSIERLNHSKLQNFKKEVKTNAIKDAREKAIYLLAALGDQVGKTIRIIEDKESEDLSGVNRKARYRSAPSTLYYFDEEKLADRVSFNKIKIEYKITARFEIK
ncbi:MAG: SIMPL domain-containing protein [Bacteroidia bacterium]